MADLISRAAARDIIADLHGLCRNDVLRDTLAKIDAIISVDAVPVIRCEDCMYWKSNMLTHFWKPCDVVSTDKDWYCPCGKRR